MTESQRTLLSENLHRAAQTAPNQERRSTITMKPKDERPVAVEYAADRLRKAWGAK